MLVCMSIDSSVYEHIVVVCMSIDSSVYEHLRTLDADLRHEYYLASADRGQLLFPGMQLQYMFSAAASPDEAAVFDASLKTYQNSIMQDDVNKGYSDNEKILKEKAGKGLESRH